jgi:aminoglycoside 3-N-acetyltransferase I
MTDLPPLPATPPGRYRHYKGGEYVVIGAARHSETLEPLVVYRPLYNASGLWVRPHAMFFGQVEAGGRRVERFTRIDQAAAQGDGAAPHQVRVLGRQDVAALRAMLAMFGRAFDEVATYTAHQPDDAYLERLLASDTFVAVAAFADGNVIGGIAGYVLPKFEQARSELYLYDLAVDAAHRRQGVATAMIGALQQLAAERGIYVMFVQADHGDDPAIALYSRLGVREDVLHFDIPPAG